MCVSPVDPELNVCVQQKKLLCNHRKIRESVWYALLILAESKSTHWSDFTTVAAFFVERSLSEGVGKKCRTCESTRIIGKKGKRKGKQKGRAPWQRPSLINERLRWSHSQNIRVFQSDTKRLWHADRSGSVHSVSSRHTHHELRASVCYLLYLSDNITISSDVLRYLDSRRRRVI